MKLTTTTQVTVDGVVHLITVPVVVGQGARLFPDATA